MNRLLEYLDIIFLCLVALGIIAVALSIIPAIFMLLWNFVMAGAFGLPEISFWDSLCIIILIQIVACIIGSFIKTD